MTQELERLKTTCLAQEVEIARLNEAFDKILDITKSGMESIDDSEHDKGYVEAMTWIDTRIKEITGIEK